ncbi:pirin family protein [Sphingomonas sp. HF-S3]|uniref:Pirin family protein n=1 Tax=Sphingomonas rustica TaxID=3103142 RepID=A0ABV0BBB8_9SPHN
MIDVRTRDTLGTSSLAELETLHHFSFGGFQDLARDNWGRLCVLNHIVMAPGGGLRTAPIDGVDLISVVRKGTIAHDGGLGGSPKTRAGEVQLICPGPGIVHADTNPGAKPAEYVELRIRMEGAPERALRRTTRFPGRTRAGLLELLASGFPQDRAPLPLNSPSRVYGARIPARAQIIHAIDPGRTAYLMALSGTVTVNGAVVGPLEGAAIADEATLAIEAETFVEMLLVETD